MADHLNARDLRALAIALFSVGLADLATLAVHAFPSLFSLSASYWMAASLVLLSFGFGFLATRMGASGQTGAKLGYSAVLLNLLPMILRPATSVVIGLLLVAATAALVGGCLLLGDSGKAVGSS